jgi:glutathione S-transferase
VLHGSWNDPGVEELARALVFKAIAFELDEAPCRGDDGSEAPPELEMDAQRLREIMAILLKLEDRFPEPPLLARAPRLAAAQRHLAQWAIESLPWYRARWQHLRSRPASPTPPPAPPRPAGVSLRDWLGRRTRAGGPATGDPGPLVHEIGQRVDDLARLLGGRAYFYAEQLSMADLAVHAMLRSLAEDRIPGTAPHLDRHPELRGFMERVEDKTGGPPPALARSVQRRQPAVDSRRNSP